MPQGLMARSMRAAIDWRFGSFDAAIAQMEGLVGSNEEYYKEKPQSRARRRVLEDFYTVLARAYLHAGHIDDAMLVVIRAKKSMGIDRLGGLAELDAQTAHLVRAGLAAGRLLEGGGLATMFVKSTPPSTPAAGGRAPQPRGGQITGEGDSAAPRRRLRRQGATGKAGGKDLSKTASGRDQPGRRNLEATDGRGEGAGGNGLDGRPEAQIIPFPTPESR
jgi:hypothetical protein